MTAAEVDGAIYGAIKATERMEKKGELGVLTRDMAAAIYCTRCLPTFTSS